MAPFEAEEGVGCGDLEGRREGVQGEGREGGCWVRRRIR